jgi:hypothetical protein
MHVIILIYIIIFTLFTHTGQGWFLHIFLRGTQNYDVHLVGYSLIYWKNRLLLLEENEVFIYSHITTCYCRFYFNKYK